MRHDVDVCVAKHTQTRGDFEDVVVVSSDKTNCMAELCSVIAR